MAVRDNWNFRTREAAGPTSTGGLHTHRFRALGTECELQFVTDDPACVSGYKAAAVNWVNAFEAKFTRFRADSLVGRINTAAGNGEWIPIDAEAEQIFDLAGTLVQMTDGLLDASALPMLRLWNFRDEHPALPTAEAIARAKSLTGWSKIQREPGRIRLPEVGMGIDLGGFGKEYAVDAVAEIARAHGIENVLVDFGHDIRARGRPPDSPYWRIGVEDPRTPGKWWCTLGINDQGVATSGDYFRRFVSGGKRYGHILDPRTGWPVDNGCLAATLIAGSCLQAGVLSTVAFLSGAKGGLTLVENSFGTEGCIVTESSLVQSRGFHSYRADG